MTDIFTRFAMQDADTLPGQGVNYPAILRGAPFVDATEVEALMLAIQAVADGSIGVTVNGVELDTGAIDFTGYNPPEYNQDGDLMVDESWEFSTPFDIADALQERLGPTVLVQWIDRSSNFRITTTASGWNIHISYARASSATDISSILRLSELSGASVTDGRVGTENTASAAGIEYPYGDWVFEPPDLVNDEGLDTAVVLSLFTDGLAAPDDPLPGAAEDDRRGWWAQPWGSKLWLLSREKWTEDVKTRAEYYARMALQWMIEDGVADRIETEARLMNMGTIAVAIAIYRDGRLLFAKPYGALWQATVINKPATAQR
jgi:phage gp46-like protein